MNLFKRSFCVVCTNGHIVVKRAFYDYDINDANQAIADVVAEAAEQFHRIGDFDVFIINIHNN